MSGFTDWMIDDGFSDPQEYMDYLDSKLDDDSNRMQQDSDYHNYYEGDYDDEEDFEDDNN